jgi:hypothetical protein
MSDPEKCQHLHLGTLPKHSTFTLNTVPKADNTTDYAWNVQVELCVYCSGWTRGRLSRWPFQGSPPPKATLGLGVLRAPPVAELLYAADSLKGALVTECSPQLVETAARMLENVATWLELYAAERAKDG